MSFGCVLRWVWSPPTAGSILTWDCFWEKITAPHQNDHVLQNKLVNITTTTIIITIISHLYPEIARPSPGPLPPPALQLLDDSLLQQTRLLMSSLLELGVLSRETSSTCRAGGARGPGLGNTAVSYSGQQICWQDAPQSDLEQMEL